MAKFLWKNSWIILFLLFSTQIMAQNGDEFKRTDVVYLKNGSIFRGQIEVYEIGKELKLRLDKDKVLIFKAKNIKKIVQEPTPSELARQEEKANTVQPVKEYAFRETGIYFGTYLGYIGGNDLFGNYTDAFNIHAFGGFQFNRWIGTEVGVGADFYNVNLGSVVPIYAAARGYLKKTNTSPYYRMAAGYGIPVNNENSIYSDIKGGYYLSPELGIRIGASAEANTTIGVSIQWQKAQYTQDFGDSISKNVDTYTYRRFNLKIGVLF